VTTVRRRVRCRRGAVRAAHSGSVALPARPGDRRGGSRRRLRGCRQHDSGSAAGYRRWREDALTATGEAVEIYRRLAAAHPDAFEPDLARGLWTFAWVRVAGRAALTQALASAEEAVTHYEVLTTGTPLAFAGDLAGALTTLADCFDCFDGLDRAEDAAAARRRAAALGSTWRCCLGPSGPRDCDLRDCLAHKLLARSVPRYPSALPGARVDRGFGQVAVQ
jgi:hypothetical protein